MGDYHPVSSQELEPVELKDIQNLTIYVSESDNIRHSLVCDLKWTIGEVRVATFEKQIENEQTVRLLYMGRILEDTDVLENLGVSNGCVLQAQIIDSKPSESTTTLPSPSAPSNVLEAGYEFKSSDLLEPEEYQGTWNTREETQAAYNPAQGTWTHFFLGLFFGIVFRELTVFWFCLTNLPRRQKAGILCGILVGALYDYFFGDRRLGSLKPNPSNPGDGNPADGIYS